MIKKLLRGLSKIFFREDKIKRKQASSFLEKLKPKIVAFETVFDVGAYQGKFTDEILKLNSKIVLHAFEPSFESFQFLKKKYHQTYNVLINNLAVSDFSGSGVINVNSFKETNSLLESVLVHKSIDILTKKHTLQTVEVIRLSDYCRIKNIEHIDLIKIDTQGNSYSVLVGMEQFLKSQKVKFLYVETEFIEIYKNEKLFSEIEILMRSFGYHIVDFYNFNYIDNEKLAWCDVLFATEK